MTKCQIQAIYPEYSELVKQYKAKGYLFSGFLRKEVFYIQKIVALVPGQCLLYRVKFYSWERAKNVEENVLDLEKHIADDERATA